MEITLRMASPADAEKMLAIYAPYVESTSITFEYVPPTVEEFTRRVERILPQYPWLVCEVDGEIAGYCYASAHHERAAFQWDAELSIYVASRFHRLGIASRLYRAITALLAAQGYYRLYSLITVPNPVSVGFHQAHGFSTIATYPATGYKLGEWHDMIVMERPLRQLQNEPVPPVSWQSLDEEFVALCLSPKEK